MAFVEFLNKLGLAITPFSQITEPTIYSSTTINAAGESTGFVGRIYLPGGTGTSKTISSAGGKIWFFPATVAWASAGSTIRVGIQDVNTGTGLEDGTYDVFDDLIQGVDTLVTSTIKEVIMSSGTKTIAHGDLIAVVMEMTVRNGTDSVNINRLISSYNFPYSTGDTGTLIKVDAGPLCAIQFDDGTIGHFGDWTMIVGQTLQTVNSGSTPDEYAMVFQFPFKCTINALILRIGEIDAGEEATAHLIKDPFGAITNLQTVTINSALMAQASTNISNTIMDIPETTIEANTEYAVSYRPTTTGPRIIRLLTLANTNFRLANSFTVLGASRTDLGAFASSTTVIPDLGVRINKIDVSSGGGGETSVAYIG